MKCVICYRVTHILCPISSGYLYQMNGQELGDALYTIPGKKLAPWQLVAVRRFEAKNDASQHKRRIMAKNDAKHKMT